MPPVVIKLIDTVPEGAANNYFVVEIGNDKEFRNNALYNAMQQHSTSCVECQLNRCKEMKVLPI